MKRLFTRDLAQSAGIKRSHLRAPRALSLISSSIRTQSKQRHANQQVEAALPFSESEFQGTGLDLISAGSMPSRLT